MSDHQFYVVICDLKGKVVKKMGPFPPRQADKVEDGANINLNHEAYYVEQRVHRPGREAAMKEADK